MLMMIDIMNTTNSQQRTTTFHNDELETYSTIMKRDFRGEPRTAFVALVAPHQLLRHGRRKKKREALVRTGTLDGHALDLNSLKKCLTPASIQLGVETPRHVLKVWHHVAWCSCDLHVVHWGSLGCGFGITIVAKGGLSAQKAGQERFHRVESLFLKANTSNAGDPVASFERLAG